MERKASTLVVWMTKSLTQLVCYLGPVKSGVVTLEIFVICRVLPPVACVAVVSSPDVQPQVRRVHVAQIRKPERWLQRPSHCYSVSTLVAEVIRVADSTGVCWPGPVWKQNQWLRKPFSCCKGWFQSPK